MRGRRILTAVVAALVCLGGLGLVGAAAEARVTTRATVFQAFNADGTPTIPLRSKSGHCWTGSLTADRNDAWRCLVGNSILDPCFSSARAPGVVVCPSPQLNGGIEIHLSKRLPRRFGNTRAPSIRTQPWDIELTNGHHCVLASGATTVVQGKRLNYFCTGGLKYGLWGTPRRRSQPWTILVAPFAAKHLHGRRAIRAAWM